MGRKLKLGLAGYAGFGQGLAKRFSAIPDVEIIGVFNRGEERRLIAEKDGYKTFKDFKEMLKEPGLDAVAIATANIVHAEQCIDAALAGKHIFCEKPLALDIDSLNKVVGACEKAGVVTHVDFSMRYGHEAIRIKELISSGVLGRVLSLWVRRGRGFGLWSAGKRHIDIVSPKVSGGWNIHHNVHGTDLLLHFAGQPAVEVYAKMSKSAPDTPCEEIITSLVTFKDGAIGYVGDSTSIQREGYLGVIGTKGSLVCVEDLNRNNKMIMKMEDGKLTEEEFVESSPMGKSGVSEACRSFTDACMGISKNNIPFREARASLDLLFAMQRSVDEGRNIKL